MTTVPPPITAEMAVKRPVPCISGQAGMLIAPAPDLLDELDVLGDVLRDARRPGPGSAWRGEASPAATSRALGMPVVPPV